MPNDNKLLTEARSRLAPSRVLAKKPYDPTLFIATAQSSNTEAGTVYDSEAGLEGPPQTTLLAGRQSVFKLGFGVANPKDVVMEVRPGFDYKSAIFTT